MWLSEKLDTENGLISLLYQQNVLTVRENECIFCMNNTFQKNESLLGLLSEKFPADFKVFLEVLKDSDQGHLAKKLITPEVITVNCFTQQLRCVTYIILQPIIFEIQLFILPSRRQTTRLE